MKPSKKLMALLNKQQKYNDLADETEKMREQVDKWIKEGTIDNYVFNTMVDVDTNMLAITTYQNKVIAEFAECAMKAD